MTTKDWFMICCLLSQANSEANSHFNLPVKFIIFLLWCQLWILSW